MSSHTPDNDAIVSPTRWKQRVGRGIVAFVFLFLAASVLFGYIRFTAHQGPQNHQGPQRTVTVVLDSDSDAPMTLRHEGADVLVIAPHSHARWKYAPGQQRITLVAGPKTVFDQEKDLAGYRKYIVNPGATSQYASWAQTYTTHFRFPTDHADAQAKFRELLDVARQIKLIEPAEWHEVRADYVLDHPPALIRADLGKGGVTRSVVCRVSKDHFDVLSESKKKGPDDPVDASFVERLNIAVFNVTFSRPGFDTEKDN
jgi:hypothetical protein